MLTIGAVLTMAVGSPWWHLLMEIRRTRLEREAATRPTAGLYAFCLMVRDFHTARPESRETAERL
jgi:hypothetical protein